jgi:hypothetical protein
MRKMARPFLGHPMTRADHHALVAVIGFAALPFGLCKRMIISEDQLWHYTDVVFGLKPAPREGFITAIHRIQNQIVELPEAARQELRRRAAEVLGVAAPIEKPIKAEKPAVIYSHGARASGAKPAALTQRSAKAKDEFYRSWEWRTLRMQVIKRLGRSCQCCGATPGQFAASGEPVRICVDHIKPLSKRWDLRLDPTNLQVLCDECNQGKGAWDATDWRAEVIEDESPMSPIEVQLGERLRIVGGTG